MEMSIYDYIRKYYCDKNKKEVHLNDINDDPDFMCNYKFYNRFHSVWLPNDKNISNKLVRIIETEEQENEIKSKEGLNSTEGKNFMTFEESTTWTYLKYIPFKVLLNELKYPICECVEKKYFWWGRLKYQEYKSEKINNIFNIHNVDDENSKEINFYSIIETLKKEGVIQNLSTNTSSLNNTVIEGSGLDPEIIKTTHYLNSYIKTLKYKLDFD